MAGDTHFEPFLHLAGLGDDEALVAWGGFWFRRSGSARSGWRIVDDEELAEAAGEPRGDSIGARSEPYGHAVVEALRDGDVVARAQTAERNHAWLRGLEPDTEYVYRVVVDGRPWAQGPRWDWSVEERTLVQGGRRYNNRFRTLPSASMPTRVSLAVLGDYGIGILEEGEAGPRQQHLARALERSVELHDVRLVLTTGDNVYLGAEDSVSGTGNEDDDWYASFYQPYRYVLNRVPFFPAVGNHDAADTERSDDRDQLDDNMFLDHRFTPEVEAGRASLGPGLFYRFGVGADLEFVCIDTSVADEMGLEHYFDAASHRDWVRDTLRSDQGDAPRWRIPFSHHPPFCAGPHHGNTTGMVDRLVPLFEQAGVRLVLSGHEHNFQHSVVGGVHYVVSGAGGKLREGEPTAFAQAGTRAWAAAGHFLLLDVDPDRVAVRPVADVRPDGELELIAPRSPDGEPVDPLIVVQA